MSLSDASPSKARAGQQWAEVSGDALRLRLRLQPGAKVSRVVGYHGDRLKIAIAAPPADGKANAALIKWLSSELGLTQKAVEIVAGLTTRDKQVLIHGGAQAGVWRQLIALVPCE